MARWVCYRVRRIRGSYFLIKEWMDDNGKRHYKSLGRCDWIERVLENLASKPFREAAAKLRIIG